jgi:hypothetical protein
MDHTMIARVYSLIAEMEALKVEVEVLKIECPDMAERFVEKADQIRGIASELQTMSY